MSIDKLSVAPSQVGNKIFRALCENNAMIYQKETSKIEKLLLVMSIVEAIRESSDLCLP
jgi:hypothetical protein